MNDSTKVKYEECKKLYLNNNMSLTQISKLMKVNRGRLSNYLKQQGVEVVNRQNESDINSNIFSVVDSEEKAYWLGFLYADGYVSSIDNHIEIGLSSIDLEHIKKFAKFINFQGEIQANDKRARISFRNKKMHEDLVSLGCLPNKSLIISFPNEEQMSKDLVPHFVRGYIDGDGYIGIHKNGFGRWGLTCGSINFLKELTFKTGWREKKILKTKEVTLTILSGAVIM